MKGLVISSKMMSMLFLIVVILISLAISGYTFFVSTHAATLPALSMPTEGLHEIEPKK